LLAGDCEGYFGDYRGTLEELAQIVRSGWLYQGQWSTWQKRSRGTPTRGIPVRRFIWCLQNHDQVGNRPHGDRLRPGIGRDRYAAAAAVLLLAPYTPLLFMGQEFGAGSPFQYFSDHSPDLGRLVTEGRRTEFRAFSAFRDPAARESIPDPQSLETFERSKL